MSRRGVLILILFATTSPLLAALPATPPRNLNIALDADLRVDFQNVPLYDAIDTLRTTTQTNLVINWPALAAAGIQRNTPVTLHLHDVPYEAVIRSLIRVLAPQDRGLNYAVGENALELTTNAALGSASQAHLYEIGPLLQKKLEANAPPEVLAQRQTTLQNLLTAALRVAGEKLTGNLVFKEGLLAATTSTRGQACLQKMLTMLESPLPRGSLPPGAAESVRAKRASDILTSLADPAGKLPLASLAAKNPTLNILLLPGAQALPSPDGLTLLIDDAGIIEIGTPNELARRVLPGVYDLSELFRRRTLRNHTTLDEELSHLLADLQTHVQPGIWGPIETAYSSLTPYAQELIVFAPAAVHRQIAAALQAMYK